MAPRRLLVLLLVAAAACCLLAAAPRKPQPRPRDAAVLRGSIPPSVCSAADLATTRAAVEGALLLGAEGGGIDGPPHRDLVRSAVAPSAPSSAAAAATVPGGDTVAVLILAMTGVAGYFTGYYTRLWQLRRAEATRVKARSCAVAAAAAVAPAASAAAAA